MDEATMFLKEKVKKNVERLMNEGALKQVDVHHYTENEMPTACDVYKVLAADAGFRAILLIFFPWVFVQNIPFSLSSYREKYPFFPESCKTATFFPWV